MELVLTKAGKKVTCETRENGALIARVTEQFRDQKNFNRAAVALGVSLDILRPAIDHFERSGDATATMPLGDAASTGFTIHYRARLAAAADSIGVPGGTARESLATALNLQLEICEPLIYWSDAHELCGLDVDYHAGNLGDRPSVEALYTLAETILPRPPFLWSTHGRGLRLMYVAAGGFTADELASVAALQVVARDPAAAVELKTITRHPRYPVGERTCGPIRESPGDCDTASLAAWLGSKEVNDDDVHDYLDSRGLSIGGRFPHSSCPVAPGDDARRDPVAVRDGGIFCHACAGRGITSGSRVAGWFSYASLIGSPIPGQLRNCIQHLTHWEHARFIVHEAVNVPPAIALAAYTAACRVVHPGDARLLGINTAGRNFVRFDRRWVTLAGECYSRDCEAIVASLPVCRYADGEGKLCISAERVARLTQPINLSDLGYPALDPIWGCRIYSHNLPLPDATRIPIVLQRRELQPRSMESLRATYVPEAQRELTEEAAWAVLDGPFSGMDRNAIRLLVAAKGVAEGEIGLPPMLFISGPTRSAKTATVALAAAIAGDSVHAIPWSSNVERLRAALHAGKENGSYVVFNEIVKDSRGSGKAVQDGLGFLLNLTPDSLSHKLYIGPVHLGSLPVCVLTDTSLPLEVIQHSQMARRLVGVNLPRQVAWEDSIKDHGISKIVDLRLLGGEYVVACNVILSTIIDRFFAYPMTFEEIAAALGFRKLEVSDEMDEKRDTLKRFFAHVAKAPDATGADSRRWAGRGWKVIDRGQQTDLCDLWRQLSDEGYTTSEKCNETDWAGLLGCLGPVAFQCRSHGGKVAVRFVRGNRAEYQVNGELHDAVELATGPIEAGVPGLRNTVADQPQTTRWEDIPPLAFDATYVSRGEAGA